jgi:hypothetical protein
MSGSRADGDVLETMDEHIFKWFTTNYPKLMRDCLAEFPDRDPAFAALVEAERLK